MKIRVTTEGKSVMVDMEPKLADKVFKALVLQLLQAGGGIESSLLRHTLQSQWRSCRQCPTLTAHILCTFT